MVLIIAVTNYGDCYYSMSQTNTNSELMELFINHLVENLEKQDPNFRKKSCVIMDNAAYHSSTDFLRAC